MIQTVVLAEQDGINVPNHYGEYPLKNNDPTLLNEKYFELVDFVLKEAEARDMYVALLPTWGDKVILLEWGRGPLLFTTHNAYQYGMTIGNRYKDQDNIIWIMGGDRIPSNKTEYTIFDSMAKGIKAVDKVHMMTFHPLGTHIASDHFNESWLDFDMFQSGHDRDIKEFDYVYRALKNDETRPIINGEGRYENIPHKFWESKEDQSIWLDEHDARVSGWWSIMAGCAGYTYGCNDVWQMYDKEKEPVIKAKTHWKKALQLPGATQMKHLRSFFESLPWNELILNQSLILSDNPPGPDYILCRQLQDFSTIVIYIPTGSPLLLDTTSIKEEKEYAWYNPRQGTYSPWIKIVFPSEEFLFEPDCSGRECDTVLVIKNA